MEPPDDGAAVSPRTPSRRRPAGAAFRDSLQSALAGLSDVDEAGALAKSPVEPPPEAVAPPAAEVGDRPAAPAAPQPAAERAGRPAVGRRPAPARVRSTPGVRASPTPALPPPADQVREAAPGADLARRLDALPVLPPAASAARTRRRRLPETAVGPLDEGGAHSVPALDALLGFDRSPAVPPRLAAPPADVRVAAPPVSRGSAAAPPAAPPPPPVHGLPAAVAAPTEPAARRPPAPRTRPTPAPSRMRTPPAVPAPPDVAEPPPRLEAPPPPSSPLTGAAQTAVEATTPSDLRGEATVLMREQVRLLRGERDRLRRSTPGGTGWSWRDLDSEEETPDNLPGLLSLTGSLREEVERLQRLRGESVAPVTVEDAERLLRESAAVPARTAAPAVPSEEAERPPAWALVLLAVSIALCIAGVVLLLHR